MRKTVRVRSTRWSSSRKQSGWSRGTEFGVGISRSSLCGMPVGGRHRCSEHWRRSFDPSSKFFHAKLTNFAPSPHLTASLR